MTDQDRKNRKDQHLDLALSSQGGGAGFEDVQLLRPALPETSLDEVDTSFDLYGKTLSAPIIIEAMTGGTERGEEINASLSRIAGKLGLGFALGSGTIIGEDKDAEASFRIAREVNPKGLIYANCSPSTPVKTIRKLLKITGADGLQVHLNVIQEALMPEGDRDFHWKKAISELLYTFRVPIVVKEVGFGLDLDSMDLLRSIGVMEFDLGGRGGTDFAAVESKRSGRSIDLSGVGLTACQSLIDARSLLDTTIRYTASGGVRTPLDALKCLALGADSIGLAAPVLKVLEEGGEEGCEAYLRDFIDQLKLLMAIHGARNISEARRIEFVLRGDLYDYSIQIEEKSIV